MTSPTTIALDLAADGVTKLDLRHEDCVDGLRSLENESVDVIVTSPPYNIDTKYRIYNDRGGRSEYPELVLFVGNGAQPCAPR